MNDSIPSLGVVLKIGKHYGEILGSIYMARLQKFAEERAEKELDDGG